MSYATMNNNIPDIDNKILKQIISDKYDMIINLELQNVTLRDRNSVLELHIKHLMYQYTERFNSLNNALYNANNRIKSLESDLSKLKYYTMSNIKDGNCDSDNHNHRIINSVSNGNSDSYNHNHRVINSVDTYDNDDQYVTTIV